MTQRSFQQFKNEVNEKIILTTLELKRSTISDQYEGALSADLKVLFQIRSECDKIIQQFARFEKLMDATAKHKNPDYDYRLCTKTSKDNLDAPENNKSDTSQIGQIFTMTNYQGILHELSSFHVSLSSELILSLTGFYLLIKLDPGAVHPFLKNLGDQVLKDYRQVVDGPWDLQEFVFKYDNCNGFNVFRYYQGIELMRKNYRSLPGLSSDSRLFDHISLDDWIRTQVVNEFYSQAIYFNS